jgi:formate dehydrogenase major subunit
MHEKNGFLTAAPVSFKLNGKSVVCGPEETILQVAARQGVEIPRLCYMEGMRPDGNCRTCMVEIKGERVLAPSCCRYPKDGMEITTNSPRAIASQKMSLELLLADVPETQYTLNSELDLWARKMSVGKPRFGARPQPAEDISHPAMAVHLDACIQCKRCVRACREEQVNDVIGYAFRSAHSKIVFDFDDPMGTSTCVACGECVQACPTGALMPARAVGQIVPDKQVDSVCPYCAGQERPRELEPPVRERPLRLRLRPAQTSPHEAADPQAGRSEAQEFCGRSRKLAGRFPRGHLGRSARSRCQRPA